jgi:hypothetical protein
MIVIAIILSIHNIESHVIRNVATSYIKTDAAHNIKHIFQAPFFS